MMKQRLFIAVFFICTIFANGHLLAQKVDYENMGMAELAQIIRPGFLFGTHTQPWMFDGSAKNQKFEQLIKKEYNLISVGIYQKITQPQTANVWKLGSIDLNIDSAAKNNLNVYAHPMFGSDGYIPDWLLNGNFNNDEKLAIIENRIKTILTRYKGKINILDVYNEGLDRAVQEWRPDENIFLSLGFHQNEYGKWPVFLEKILIWCRQYGGDDLMLIYNDNHNTLAGMPQTLECASMFKALKHAGIPIDGLGIQCHTKITTDGKHMLSAAENAIGPLFDAELFAQSIHDLGATGAIVLISECDVHIYGDITPDKLQKQADAYRTILSVCINEPACVSFKTWGFTDASCWNPNKKDHKRSDPLAYDDQLAPKPAYSAMKNLLVEMARKKDKVIK